MPNFTDSIKAALAKKHAAQHPDAQAGDKDAKGKPARAPVVANKPQKKVTGRGR
jgi:hypothetical protein